METEVLVVYLLVGFMVFIAVLPLFSRLWRRDNHQKDDAERKKKKKKGVQRLQVCLQPGCIRCAYSSDGPTRTAFKKYMWEAFIDHLNLVPSPEDRRKLQVRIGPAIKQLVTRPSSGPLSSPAGCLLHVKGLPPLPTPLMKIKNESDITVADDSLAWLARLLPSLSVIAEEARRLWRGREEHMNEWRKDHEEYAPADEESTREAEGWKWDLWRQGSFIEPHAQYATDTVRLLSQYATDHLMTGCAFGFVYFHFIAPASQTETSTSDTEDEVGLRRRHGKGGLTIEERTKPVEKDVTSKEQHCGPSNARLRCRFVLSTADDAKVVLSADTFEEIWESGTCLVHEGSQAQNLRIRRQKHAARHDEEYAIALVVDLWHPALEPVERKTLCTLFPESVDVNSSTLVD